MAKFVTYALVPESVGCFEKEPEFYIPGIGPQSIIGRRMAEQEVMNEVKKTFGIADIAAVAHEANRAYCRLLEDYSQPEWKYAPEWQQKSAIEGVKFHLKHLEAGEPPDPAASHNAWLKQKEADGWKFGVVKDPEAKTHPCFVPYAELPLEQKMKDYLFAAVVEAFFRASKEE